MLLDVVFFELLDDYMIKLTFENNERRLFDCKLLFDKKPYSTLKNKKFFSQAKLAFGTLVWSEDIDISPELFYFQGVPI